MSESQANPLSASSPTWSSRASSAADAESLAALADIDPTALGGPDLVDAIVSSEKAMSLLAGTQMRLLNALAQPFVAGDPMRLAARLARKNCAIADDDSSEMVQSLVPDAAISLASAEVAAALRISPVTAGIRVREAQTMITVLAPTLNALEDGTLDRGKARTIADHCEPLSPENKAAVQELVLPLAGEATTSELRELTGQAVITVDPHGSDDRHRAAAARRELAIKSLPDAMASLRALLPADAAVKIFQLTDLLATATAGVPGDKRGIGARRVDALADIADQLLTLGSLDLSHYLGKPLPDHGTPRKRVSVDDEPDSRGGEAPRPTSTDPDIPGPTDDPSDNEPVGVEGVTTSPDLANTDSTADQSTPANVVDTARSTTSPDLANNSSADAATLETLVDAGVRTSPDLANIDSTADQSTPDIVVEPAPDDMIGMSDSDRPAMSSDSQADGSPADTDLVTDASSTRSAQRNRKSRPVQPAGQDGREHCTACGSTRRPETALTRQGRRPHLSVTLGLGTLAGLDNLPGKLAGFGAIPPGLARSIAKSAATITTLLTDPETGAITDAGALVYRPRQALRDQIAALLSTCQFPSCRQPVWRCDIDHREPFDHQNPDKGGHTTRENTGPYCRRHHLFKHHTEWRTRPDPNNGTVTWISPTGHRYVKGRCLANPPAIWVTTAGTAIAERLDNMTTTADVGDGTGTAGSVVEEILTALLLRHELTRPPFEYDPTVKRSTGDAGSINGSSGNGSSANDGSAHDNSAPDGAGSPRSAPPAHHDPAGFAVPNPESWPEIDDPPPF